MRCPYCNNKIEKKWNFCPKCGRRIEKRFDLFDIFSKIFSNNYEPTRAHEITINLSSDFDHPMISVKPAKTLKPYEKKIKISNRKFSGDVLEPNTEIKRLGEKIIVNMELPGIKTIDDIQIDRIYNSSEIKAFGKDKGYFKILNIPRKYKLIKKNLNKEKLELVFSIN